MTSRVTQLDIINAIIDKAEVLGNSHYDHLSFCSDLINDFGTDKKSLEYMSKITFLSTETLRRVASLKEAESGEPYRPQYDTLKRIMVFFGISNTFQQVRIKPTYRSQPKKEEH
jgi:hypothetical protein